MFKLLRYQISFSSGNTASNRHLQRTKQKFNQLRSDFISLSPPSVSSLQPLQASLFFLPKKKCVRNMVLNKTKHDPWYFILYLTSNIIVYKNSTGLNCPTRKAITSNIHKILNFLNFIFPISVPSSKHKVRHISTPIYTYFISHTYIHRLACEIIYLPFFFLSANKSVRAIIKQMTLSNTSREIHG